ncbi:MAG: integration host factor subunit alpha, partial [Alphaproteobacteria bacterium]|nr:integration host factor subunit alpha [Alphaproteobacteria bacterium]
YQEIGLSRKVSEEILDMILSEISQELADGNSVKISSFGTFLVRKKNPRIGRNPKTGVDAVISARKVISFKPSQIMRNNINKK